MNKSTKRILEGNRAMREGRVSAPTPTRLEEGYADMRIPEEHWPMLKRVLPELNSKDPVQREAAWEALRHSELGKQYRVVRDKRAVRNAPKGIIVR